MAEGASGFSLIVFRAAEDADAVLVDTGTLFNAAVSVLRIFNGLSMPLTCVLLSSVSAMITILFRNDSVFYSYYLQYSMEMFRQQIFL